MKVSLCIPMYNESAIISSTLEAVCAYMEANFDEWEVIFSDDGSMDGCRETVDAFPNGRIRTVGYEHNKGKGAAVRNGVLNAKGDIIIFTDCDLAYGLDVVKVAVDMFLANPDADIIVGSRNIGKDGYDGYTLLRKMASKAYIKCLALVGGFKLTDSQCGFKGFRKQTAHEIFSSCEVDGFAFDFEVLIKAGKIGARILEMPVKVMNHRQSKVSVLRDSVKMLGDVRRIKKRNK